MKIPYIIPDNIEVFGQIKKLLKVHFADNIIHRKTGLGHEVRLIFEDETLIVGMLETMGNLLPVCIEAIKGVDSGTALVTLTDRSCWNAPVKRCQHSARDTYLINTVEASNYIRRARYSASDIKEIVAAHTLKPQPDKTSKAVPANKRVFWPLRNWCEVELNGEIISLGARERAKDFLRLLWERGAKKRSKAIAVPKNKFSKPSSLFCPGMRLSDERRWIKNKSGALIHRVYREAVGVVKCKQGTGPHRYYLRAFLNSDDT